MNPNTAYDYGINVGGFNPSYAQYLIRNNRMRSNSALHAQILQSDPRAQFMAGIWNQNMGVTGTPSNTTMLMAGSLVNSRALSGLFGGSRLDMFAGIHTGLSNAGSLMFGSERVRGMGAITGITAQAMMNQMERQMFNNTGGARLHRTGGLDRGQLGRTVAYAAASGGYGDLGNVGRRISITGANQQAQIDAAMAVNDTDLAEDIRAITASALKGGKSVEVMAISRDARKKFAKVTEEYAQAVGSIQDIMGDIGDNNLFRALEDLAGFSGAGAGTAAKQRLNRIRQMSASGAGSAEGLIRTFTQLSQAGRAMGFNSQHAATIAERSLSAQAARGGDDQRARAMFAEQGLYIQDMTEAGHRQRMLQQTFMQDEMPELSAMLYAVQTAPGLSADERDRLRGQIQAAGSAPGSAADRRARLLNMQGRVEAATGASAGFWLQHADGDALGKLDAQSQAVFGQISAAEANQRNLNRLGQDMRTAFGGDRGRAQAMVDLARDYSAGTILDMAKGQTGQRARDMQFLAQTLLQREYAQGIVSKESRQNQDARELEALHVANALGDQPKSVGSIVEGLMGGTSIGSQQVMEYLQATGVKGHEWVLTGKSTSERLELVRRAQAKGYGVTHKKGGKYMVYKPGEMVTGTKALEEAQIKQMAESLGVEKAKTMSDVYKGLTKENLMKDFSADRLETFMGVANTDAGGRAKLLSAIESELKDDKYKDPKGDADKKKKEQLEEARAQLKEQQPFDPHYALNRIVSLLQQIVEGSAQ